jgi:hypothetical protein
VFPVLRKGKNTWPARMGWWETSVKSEMEHFYNKNVLKNGKFDEGKFCCLLCL